jgi:hypothetical protein
MPKKPKARPAPAAQSRPGKNGKYTTPAPAPRSAAGARAAAPAAPARTTTSAVEKKPAAADKSVRSYTHEDIARAAYCRWEKFGGNPEDNWVAAERELAAAHGTTKR